MTNAAEGTALTVPLTLKQSDIDTAVARKGIPIADLEMRYVAPRLERGLTGVLEIPTDFFEEAVIAYAKTILRPELKYIKVDFAYSRTDGAIRADVLASTEPFTNTTPEPVAVKPVRVTVDDPVVSKEEAPVHEQAELTQVDSVKPEIKADFTDEQIEKDREADAEFDAAQQTIQEAISQTTDIVQDEDIFGNSEDALFSQDEDDQIVVTDEDAPTTAPELVDAGSATVAPNTVELFADLAPVNS